MDQYEIETLIKNIDDRTIAHRADSADGRDEGGSQRVRDEENVRLTRRRKTCAKRASERVDTLMWSPTASRRASRLSPTDTKGWTTGSPAWAEISSQYLQITSTESRCWKRTRPNDDSGDQTSGAGAATRTSSPTSFKSCRCASSDRSRDRPAPPAARAPPDRGTSRRAAGSSSAASDCRATARRTS